MQTTGKRKASKASKASEASEASERNNRPQTWLFTNTNEVLPTHSTALAEPTSRANRRSRPFDALRPRVRVCGWKLWVCLSLCVGAQLCTGGVCLCVLRCALCRRLCVQKC
jgi:hypothetical protein